MLIYRIDYELIAGARGDGLTKRLSFRATKPEVDQLKRECGTSLSSFNSQRVDVPTDRYGLVGWLNKTFGSKATERASAK